MHDIERELLVSVIVPFYNEEENLGEVLERLEKLQETLSLEIIAVDDGSTDDSVKIAKEFQFVRLIRHGGNFGKGKAIATGLAHSEGEIIVIQDADCEYAPEEIPKLVKPIIEGQSDIVFGSRFMRENSGMSLSHMFGNKILSLVASFLYSARITDVMTGHKSFSRKAINSIDLSERGFEVEVELTGKLLAQHWKFKEVPITYRKRQQGKSKIKYRDGLTCLLKLTYVRFKNSKTTKPQIR